MQRMPIKLECRHRLLHLRAFLAGIDAVHHEIKMLNIDNEAIRERVEENMNFKNFRITTFCCEACAEYQRSRIDSEN